MAFLARICILVALLWTVVSFFRSLRLSITGQHARCIGKGIGIFMLAQETVDRLGHIVVLSQPPLHNLPLHICGVSIITVALLLVFRSRLLFDFSYFAGLSGAVQAVLTPDITVTFPQVLFFTYFSSHYLIFIGVLYAVVVYGMRPDWRSLRNAVVITNLYAAFIYGINHLLGTNYLFLHHKPNAESLMDLMGPWPYYILGLEACMLASFGLLYLLFRWSAIRHRSVLDGNRRVITPRRNDA